MATEPPELPEQPSDKYEPIYQPGPYPAGPYPYGYEPHQQGPPPRRGIGWLGITLILLGLVLALATLIAVLYFGLFTPGAI